MAFSNWILKLNAVNEIREETDLICRVNAVR
jgi:hypothetical protein